MSVAWYDELRDRYRPKVVQVLLIGESPPDAADGTRRFFYAPKLDNRDNLFRGVAAAAYGMDPHVDANDKVGVLQRLQRDGYWLIDLSDEPVNHLEGAARRRALRVSVAGLVARAVDAAPTRGAIVCKTPVHTLVTEPLRAAGVPVLHDKSLPFPMNWSRERFVAGFREAVHR